MAAKRMGCAYVWKAARAAAIVVRICILELCPSNGSWIIYSKRLWLICE